MTLLGNISRNVKSEPFHRRKLLLSQIHDIFIYKHRGVLIPFFPQPGSSLQKHACSKTNSLKNTTILQLSSRTNTHNKVNLLHTFKATTPNVNVKVTGNSLITNDGKIWRPKKKESSNKCDVVQYYYHSFYILNNTIY